MPLNNLYAPVARFGFALSARASVRGGKSRRFLLRDRAAGPAVAALEKQKGDFEDAVERKLRNSGWTIDKRGRADNLADFEFDLRHGVIADFMERAISREDENTEFLVRFCVTVCSQPAAIGGEDKPKDGSLVIWQDRADRSMPQHSKIWIRLSCLKFRSKRLHELSLEQMRTFHDEARVLAGKIKAAIISPYKEILSTILQSDPEVSGASVSIETVFNIDSFTVSVSDDEFPSSYRQLVLGEGLSDVSQHSLMRNSLDSLKGAFDSSADELLPIDDLGFQRGVYWINLDKTQASLVGVASNSLDTDSGNALMNDLRALKSAPSNIIGILSGTMLASAI